MPAASCFAMFRRYVLITPCRDEAAYLQTTIDSVAAQSVLPTKWVIVDDGSTDGTSKLAEEYGARVVRIPNGGLSNARNVGWRAARGEIVAYLDDDASQTFTGLST